MTDDKKTFVFGDTNADAVDAPKKADAPLPRKVDEGTLRPESILDQLKVELAKKVEKPEIEVNVPGREGVTLRFSPNITVRQMREWQNRSGIKGKEGLDVVKYSTLVIGNTCTGIYFNGQLVANDEGIPLGFADDAILGLVGEVRAIPEGVVSFFGLDSHVTATAVAIMEASGLSDEVEPVDPTKMTAAGRLMS